MRKIFWILTGIILFIIIFGKFLIDLTCDWWWYQQTGYIEVFLTIWKAKLVLGFIFGSLFFVVLGLNLLLTEKLRFKGPKVVGENILEILSESFKKKSSMFTSKIITLALAIVSLFLAVQFAGQWELFLQFLKAQNFNITDPIFSKNIGFYVFKLPFIRFLYAYLNLLLWLSLIIITFVYLWSQSIQIIGRRIYFTKSARIHLFTILTLILLLKAIGYKLSSYNLLYSYSPERVFYGTSFTDFYINLPVLKILMAVAILCALISLINVFVLRWKFLAGSIITLVLASFLGLNVLPGVVQKFIVVPNELSKEKKFIALNVKYTNLAYNLDKTEDKVFPVQQKLTRLDIDQNPQTIKNIRLWDHGTLLKTYRQLQEIRTYYDFVSVGNDRYYVSGKYLQCMLSARELNVGQLKNRGWINEHLIFTHGYGLCLGPVNKVTSEGLPEFFIKDIPPQAAANITVSTPQIYYGELTSNYCFVKTKQEEFDYPAGEKNVYYNYQGPGGVKVNSFLKKLIFALKFSEFKILFSTDITSKSKIMYYRQILERVRKITPLVYYDSAPYLVVSNKKLYWICDGYTITNNYPYSKPVIIRRGNYIRNSVKAVIDAFTGRTQFYISDPEDPLVKVQSKIFPQVFKPLKEMSPDLQKHLRYPLEMFKVQAKVYASYHMKNPQVFYNQEDLWRIPFIRTGKKAMSPYYTILKFPGAKKEEFILMIPFSPDKKNNMIAWLAARCDFPHYGKLIVYKFPKQKLIYGPTQIEARIDQNPEISERLTLWGQGGSQVIRGSLLVIPIADSLIYVEPLYLAAERSQLPELKRVIVAMGERIAMAPTLEMALEEIFGKAAVSVPTKKLKPETKPGKADWKKLARQANVYFKQLESSQKRGQWDEYGKNLQNLQRVLEELLRQAEK